MFEGLNTLNTSGGLRLSVYTGLNAFAECFVTLCTLHRGLIGPLFV